jgi:hypothetical protein
MDDDPATTYDRLRIETAAMLGFDYAALTAAQGVRVDRAAMLRLELDDCQTKKLAGEPFDTNKYIATSEALERLLGSDPETSTAHDFSGAREELARLLAGRAEAIERHMAREPEKFRRELEEKLACAIAKHNPGSSVASDTDASKPAVGGDAQSSVPHPPPSEAPADGGGLPVLISPAPPPPPPPQASAAERARNVERLNSQPANPPSGPLPEWRRWVDENGIRTSPWSGGRY